MVLSDRYGGSKSPGIWKRTLLYIFGFGFGSLAIAALLSLVFVSVAEEVLPSKTSGTDTPALDGKPDTVRSPSLKTPLGKSKSFAQPAKPGSKKTLPRVNETKHQDEQPL